MTNLYEETNEFILEAGYKWEDVTFIGSSDGEYECSYEEFKVIANTEYDQGYGSPEVAMDLMIVLKDGSHIYREEYDGAENWAIHRSAPAIKTKKIKYLTGGSWDTVEALNTKEM